MKTYLYAGKGARKQFYGDTMSCNNGVVSIWKKEVQAMDTLIVSIVLFPGDWVADMESLPKSHEQPIELEKE